MYFKAYSNSFLFYYKHDCIHSFFIDQGLKQEEGVTGSGDEGEDDEYEDVDDDSDDGEKAPNRGKGCRKKRKAGAKYKTAKSGKGLTLLGSMNKKQAWRERTLNSGDLLEVEVIFTSSWAKVLWQVRKSVFFVGFTVNNGSLIFIFV